MISDIKQAVFLERWSQVASYWEKFGYYSQGLESIIRNDYEKIDADAARYIEMTPANSLKNDDGCAYGVSFF